MKTPREIANRIVDDLYDELETALVAERQRADALAEALRAALAATDALIASSHGVTGLHLNGDIAPWDELMTGGRFEDWLRPLDDAAAALAAYDAEAK